MIKILSLCVVIAAGIAILRRKRKGSRIPSENLYQTKYTTRKDESLTEYEESLMKTDNSSELSCPDCGGKLQKGLGNEGLDAECSKCKARFNFLPGISTLRLTDRIVWPHNK